MSTIDYDSNTLDLQALKRRLDYLIERHKYGQPEEDADQAIWDEWNELKDLENLAADLSWCWDNDENRTFISNSHWQEWCEQECYSIGDIREGSFVTRHVDWEAVARSMAQDYKVCMLPDNHYFYTRG